MVNIVRKHPVKEFTLIHSNRGLTLCEKQDGAFLTLRYAEDIANLKSLIDGIVISKEFKEKPHESVSISASMKVTYSLYE